MKMKYSLLNQPIKWRDSVYDGELLSLYVFLLYFYLFDKIYINQKRVESHLKPFSTDSNQF